MRRKRGSIMEGFKINHTPNATKLPTVPGANGISQRIEQFL